MAPSWMARAISFILSVPSSAASTPRMRLQPTSRARMAVAAENHSQNHSVLPRVKSWKPPSDASTMHHADSSFLT